MMTISFITANLLFWFQLRETIVFGFGNEKDYSLKYILMWSKIYHQEILEQIIPEGQQFFIQKDCPVNKCFFSWDRYYLADIDNYDALLFHGPNFIGHKFELPESRTMDQVYVYINKESPGHYPICEDMFNGLYNMTFTYRLGSEVKYYYLIVKNNQGDIIGPNETMHWMNVEDMMAIGDDVKDKLKWKHKAAAWLVSHCDTRSKRELIAEELQEELKQYSLSVDIYGKCGSKECGESEGKTMEPDENCWKLIQADYFFYLSFENSFDEDYVTEKVLNPLQYYTVPIVYGGANYTRFMPDGIYLDARKLGVKKLARQMYEIMNNKMRYYSFFKWHNHYAYHDPYDDPKTDPFCQLCACVNDRDMVQRRKVYHDFINWWNVAEKCPKEVIDFDSRRNAFNLLRIR